MLAVIFVMYISDVLWSRTGHAAFIVPVVPQKAFLKRVHFLLPNFVGHSIFSQKSVHDICYFSSTQGPLGHGKFSILGWDGLKVLTLASDKIRF